MPDERACTENDSLLTESKTVEYENTRRKIAPIEVEQEATIRRSLTENDYSLITELKEAIAEREKDKRNNLEKYLDELYEKEIECKAEQDEVELIRNGVETLVKELIRATRAEEKERLEKEVRKFKEAFRGLQPVGVENLDDEGILNVGSFYEGTQNGFPDDFDFIFVLGNFRATRATRSLVRYEDTRYHVLYDLNYRDRDNFAHNAIRAVASRIHCIYMLEGQADRSISDEEMLDLNNMAGCQAIVLDEYIIIDEKASKLRFIYQNERREKRYIYVYITPAFRVFEPKEVRENDDICQSPFVKEEVAKTGSVLVAGGLVWFSETEVNFMKNKISKRHRDAYKIVKYLIGGKIYTDAIYHRLVETGLWRYNTGIMTSFMIKAGVISHHYACKHQDIDGVAPCIIDILTFLKDIRSNENVQLLTDVVHMPNFFRSEIRYNRLRDIINAFHTHRKLRDSYSYDRCKVVPVNKELLECFGNGYVSKTVTKSSYRKKVNKLSSSLDCTTSVVRYLLLITMVVYTLVTFHVLTGYFGDPYP